MKRSATIAAALILAAALGAKAQDCQALYNRLVERVGYAGVGVETVLDKWEKADSTDINMMVGRFSYWFAKSRRDTVEMMDCKKYLGSKPLVALKDSTGAPKNYFEVQYYDDTAFGNGIKWLDKAIRRDNTRLDVRMLKADALVAYEKGSPDLTLQLLLDVIKENFTKNSKWEYPGEKVDATFFDQQIQNICFILFSQGTEGSYEAFKTISATMLKYEKNNANFLCNMGAYFQSAKGDDKKAATYYKKVLKTDPDNEVAKKNMDLIARKAKIAAAKKAAAKNK